MFICCYTSYPVVSSDSSGPVDRSDAMDALGTNVIMNITNIGTQGYPGTGKTSLLDLAMGKEHSLERNSTGCIDPPSRYLVIKSGDSDKEVTWEHVTTEKMFDMVCTAARKVIDEGLTSKDTDPHFCLKDSTTVVSQSDPLPRSDEISTVGEKEQATLTENTSLRVPADTTQPPPFPPLPPPYTIFPKLLTQLHKSERSGVIFDSHWMMVTDCGGQPPFLDASALFLRNSCLQIFPLKLNECLNEKPNFSYFIDGKPVNLPTSSLPLTNLQVIETLAKAVAAFQQPRTLSALKSPDCAKFAIVGTFEDQKENCKEDVEAKETCLKNVLKSYNSNLVRYRGRVILPVNAATTDKVERKRYATMLQNLITRAAGVTMKVEVKLRWFGFLLSLLTLSEKEKPILQLDECFRIGSSLNMDRVETLKVIQFFHDIGVIMHFDTPKLRNWVIVDAKPVLDKVSQLISVSFVDEEFLEDHYNVIPPSNTKQRLQEQGRFNKELMEKFKFSEPITLQLFLDILKHVKAVAMIDNDKPEYFMPCALAYASHEQSEPLSCSSNPPWVIRFRMKQGTEDVYIPLPVGYLPALVVFLLTNFPSDFSTDQMTLQYRNVINLRYKAGDLGSVYIVERHLQLEVYVEHFELVSSECLHIRNCVLEAMCLTEEQLHITKGSITKVDCFLYSCGEGSSHHSNVGVYSCKLRGVKCEETRKIYPCSTKCLHWIPPGI